MSDDTTLVEMRIGALIMDPNTNTPIVVLKGIESETVLPIWVGAFEANAIALEIDALSGPARDPLAEYRRVNTEATLRLAEAAARQGVRRFVFLSTVKVNGERTTGAPFGSKDPAAPVDPYAVSKWEAEQGLAGIAGLEVTVLRPPLV